MAHVTYTVFNRDGWRIAIGETESAAFESRAEAVDIAMIIASFRRQAGDDVDLSIRNPGNRVEHLWCSRATAEDRRFGVAERGGPMRQERSKGAAKQDAEVSSRSSRTQLR
jgi:hypothetical protein